MIKVALVGRPNVGKSTIFNRLVGSGKAIVHNQPGVTRDRKYSNASLVDINFILIDTAGIEEKKTIDRDNEIFYQTESAINESDIIIFVVDGIVGILPVEKSFATNLIKKNKTVLVLINKCEGSKGLLGYTESTSLGFDINIPFSAEHGEGLIDLYHALNKTLKFKNHNISNFVKKETEKIRIGIVGRPNTGKSTLINNIIGEKRLVTGSEAGITRDSIEIPWSYKNNSFCIVDTAGLRKKSKILKTLEKHMVSDTLKSIKFSNICILLVNAKKGFDKQDLSIARMIIGEGRGLIIGANMWDQVEKKHEARQNIYNQLEKSLSQIKNVSVVFISGLHGQGINKLMDFTLDVKRRLDTRISTGKLNRWLLPIIENNPAPLYKGKTNRIRYITQVNIRPPTFAFFISSPENLPNSYKRYLTSILANEFNLFGLPIRIMLRKGNNPYVDN